MSAKCHFRTHASQQTAVNYAEPQCLQLFVNACFLLLTQSGEARADLFRFVVLHRCQAVKLTLIYP